ncbi:MAG TPA: hypothetical protein DCQ98_17585 [Planctomycetaceae bacterium]|nr:hypothetical protein [Planctomycetaceae bacterium]HRE99578.1 ABC transporter ATP-binding protein [Pirellulaceae bacterium]
MSRSEQHVARIEHVSKKFCRNLHRSLRYGMVDLAREAIGLGPTAGLRRGEFWAVRDVSLSIRPGESLALMGANGAGKSTLLKMVQGLIRPDEGRIRVRGRMGALTQLGAGFNAILSGRENVYINAAILGVTKSEVDRRFDAMVDFAGLDHAIDDPVRTYSSGMRARLGYSIAAFLQPDLLLMDEVLATGDIAFRMKCFAHIESLIAQGTSVIVVTHMIGRIAQACNRFAVLDQGSIVYDGEVEEGMRIYRRLLRMQEAGNDEADDEGNPTARSTTAANPATPPSNAAPSNAAASSDAPMPSSVAMPSITATPAAPLPHYLGAAWIDEFRIIDVDGNDVTETSYASPLRLRVRLTSEERLDEFRLRIRFDGDGETLTVIESPRRTDDPLIGSRTVEVEVTKLNLLAGTYQVCAELIGGRPQQTLSERRTVLNVRSAARAGRFVLSHRWIDGQTVHVD